MRLVDGVFAGGKQLVGGFFILRSGHPSVVGEHADDGQIVTLSHFKVVGVVGGRNLDHAGALGHIGMLVQDDGNLLVQQRQDHMAAMQMRIARIFRVDGDSRIAQHSFRTGGGQLQHFPRFLHRIQQVPEIAFLLRIFDFRVRQGGVAAGAPVDQAVSAVDQLLFIQAHEDFAHRAGAAFVHGKAFPGPVAGGAHAAQLTGDGTAVFLFPFPGALEELFAAQLLLGQAFGAELIHDFDFRGDRGMIRAGQPESRISLHAVVAHQRVLQGIVHCVAHVKLAGNIGRRHHDGKGLL